MNVLKHGWEFSGWEFSRWEFSGCEFSRGSLMSGNFPGGSFPDTITNKVNKSIGLLRKLQKFLPRRSLVTIYKSFIRTHIDYAEIIFDQVFNKPFQVT